LNYLQQDPGTSQLIQWFGDAKIEVEPATAILVEDDRGGVATILRYEAFRDSHWLRIEALMRVGGMETVQGGDSAHWSSKTKDPKAGRSVARLNQSVIAVGNPAVVTAIIEAARTRRKQAGPLREMLSNVPLLADAWLIVIPEKGPEGSGCAGVTGHLVLDDGLLVELRWMCAEPRAARDLKAELQTIETDTSLAKELLEMPTTLTFLRGGLFHQVGNDVIFVATATDTTVRALVRELIHR